MRSKPDRVPSDKACASRVIREQLRRRRAVHEPPQGMGRPGHLNLLRMPPFGYPSAAWWWRRCPNSAM
ncbi:hypothetical protein [Lentzea sp. NPDC003310]|uniref:hypothetical protein n=1 Tax=Lentzea sp. NPDC003310 TaxID=3154447 RepID=UPI0033A5FCE4